MKGTVTIEIEDKNESFKVTLNRKVTILRGDSGIGKTVFHNLVRRYYENINSRNDITFNLTGSEGIIFPSSTNKLWQDELKGKKNQVVFIDEDNKNVLKDGNIGGIIKRSDLYFLVITRKPLKIYGYEDEDYLEEVGIGGEDDLINLSQSVEGTLTLKGTKLVKNDGRFFYINESIPLYNSLSITVNPDLVITEDLLSGNQFFLKTLDKSKVNVVSAITKTNVLDTLLRYASSKKYKSIYLVIDTENFGFELNDIEQSINTKEFKELGVEVTISDIRSFEYLLLKAIKLFKENLLEVLENTQNYCDVSVYSNWEKFYHHLLSKGYIRERKENGSTFVSFRFIKSAKFDYDKSDLDEYFLRKEIVESVYNYLGDIDKSLIKIEEMP